MKDVVGVASYNFSILVLLFAIVHSFEECSTPDGEPGECVQLKSCSSILEIIRKKPLSDVDRIFLKQSQCKTLHGPWVCCPLSVLPVIGESICGTTSKDYLGNRIFGGTETSIGEFPWMAVIIFIKDNGKTSYGCGGSLITKKHVLTAAHCVIEELFPNSWSLSHVRLGEWDRRTNPDCQEIDDILRCAHDYMDIAISNVSPHELYDSSSNSKVHDIALITLEVPIVYTDFVRPLCLFEGERNFDFGTGTVIGFGKTETGNSSERLLQVQIDIERPVTCKRKYRIQGRTIEESQICAYRYQADSCNGDSGSPLMRQSGNLRWYIIGVTSFGPAKCGKAEYPGIYTKVNDYVEWIKSKIIP